MKSHTADTLRTMALSLAVLLLSAILPTAVLAGGADKPDHIFFIMMENHPTSQIIGNTADAPFINKLALGTALPPTITG
jgi:hypothetical protein